MLRSRPIFGLVLTFATVALLGCVSSPTPPPERFSLDASDNVGFIRSWQADGIQVSRRWSDAPAPAADPVPKASKRAAAPTAAPDKVNAGIAAAKPIPALKPIEIEPLEIHPPQTATPSLVKPAPAPKFHVSANETPVDHEAPLLPEYHVGPGDEVRVLVFGQQELSGTYQIATNGTIAFPLLGDVPSESLSASELSQRLTDRLSDGIIKHPSVSVEIVRYRPIYILGEVRNPGSYPFTPGMTVLKAVATAGGFSYRANRRKVLITRSTEPLERSYELSGAIVTPGDTLRIPDKLF